MSGEELISCDEWIRMGKGIRQKSNGDYLMGRNTDDGDLCVPTVLRENEKKLVGQSEL